jgi:hypothetical protein
MGTAEFPAVGAPLFDGDIALGNIVAGTHRPKLAGLPSFAGRYIKLKR